jgi:hypothetical protein
MLYTADLEGARLHNNKDFDDLLMRRNRRKNRMIAAITITLQNTNTTRNSTSLA